MPESETHNKTQQTCLEIKTHWERFLNVVYLFLLVLCVHPLHAQQGLILKISCVAFVNVLH